MSKTGPYTGLARNDKEALQMLCAFIDQRSRKSAAALDRFFAFEGSCSNGSTWCKWRSGKRYPHKELLAYIPYRSVSYGFLDTDDKTVELITGIDLSRLPDLPVTNIWPTLPEESNVWLFMLPVDITLWLSVYLFMAVQTRSTKETSVPQHFPEELTNDVRKNFSENVEEMTNEIKAALATLGLDTDATAIHQLSESVRAIQEMISVRNISEIAVFFWIYRSLNNYYKRFLSCEDDILDMSSADKFRALSKITQLADEYEEAKTEIALLEEKKKKSKRGRKNFRVTNSKNQQSQSLDAYRYILQSLRQH